MCRFCSSASNILVINNNFMARRQCRNITTCNGLWTKLEPNTLAAGTVLKTKDVLSIFGFWTFTKNSTCKLFESLFMTLTFSTFPWHQQSLAKLLQKHNYILQRIAPFETWYHHISYCPPNISRLGILGRNVSINLVLHLISKFWLFSF